MRNLGYTQTLKLELIFRYLRYQLYRNSLDSGLNQINDKAFQVLGSGISHFLYNIRQLQLSFVVLENSKPVEYRFITYLILYIYREYELTNRSVEALAEKISKLTNLKELALSLNGSVFFWCSSDFLFPN